MSNDQPDDNGRRNAIVATSVVGGIGALCTAYPFVSTFAPSEKARAAGAPVEVDIAQLKEGERMVVEWRGKPVWILKRSKEMLDSLAKTESKVADPKSERKPSELTPEYCRNQARSIKPEILVAVGICSHLGCSPSGPFPTGANVALGTTWASCARATAPPSTWPAACGKPSPRRTTSRFRRTCT